MDCPACLAPMDQQTFDAMYGRTVTIDLCHACTGIWFDRLESLGLTPGAVLKVFRLIHDRRPQAAPPSAGAHCPRCHARLVPTQDRQRNTRFNYQRCPAEHGHFITFFEFLREKNFVRPLSPNEVAVLKARVGVVHCSACGAPVDLALGAACGYCHAPLSMLDAEQLQRTVAALDAAETRRLTIDPTLPARLTLDRLAVERTFREAGVAEERLDLGLVDAGLRAVVQALGLTSS